MTSDEVMQFLQDHGSEQTRKVLRKHGARDPFYGVRISDLTIIQKKVKKDHNLALKLYATGNSDAMYLAGMIADPELFDRATLQEWTKKAYWYMISDYTIPGVASRSPVGFNLALEWIDSDSEFVASAGWATLSSYISLYNLDQDKLIIFDNLLERVEKNLHHSKNRVRYTMNNFIIACGSYQKELNEKALKFSSSIGKVSVDMGGTACKVPDAKQYINKVISMGKLGVKRKK